MPVTCCACRTWNFWRRFDGCAQSGCTLFSAKALEGARRAWREQEAWREPPQPEWEEPAPMSPMAAQTEQLLEDMLHAPKPVKKEQPAEKPAPILPALPPMLPIGAKIAGSRKRQMTSTTTTTVSVNTKVGAGCKPRGDLGWTSW